jgi:hypothetical protein
VTPLSEGRQTLRIAISAEGELKALAAPQLSASKTLLKPWLNHGKTMEK